MLFQLAVYNNRTVDLNAKMTNRQNMGTGLQNLISGAAFGPDTKVKFRPHHFPFTEPSAEMDGKPVVTMDEVLHDISFTAKAGQKTALVGESGSGKSTLAKLLIHYYDPQKGSISIGGQKLCNMSHRHELPKTKTTCK